MIIFRTIILRMRVF